MGTATATPTVKMHPRAEAEASYHALLTEAKRRGPPFDMLISKEIAERDLYFFLVFVLNRHDAMHDWVFERCREVQTEPDTTFNEPPPAPGLGQAMVGW